ncbi:MAG: hypothetical protein HOV79_19200 [Hamadaea sp.]|nr:hypothetical protein [Hamadaea sp.]
MTTDDQPPQDTTEHPVIMPSPRTGDDPVDDALDDLVDDSAGAAEPAHVGSIVPRLADDYYVTLHPLTLEFVATQMERLDLKFDRRTDVIIARWADFHLEIRVFDEILSVRGVLASGYPSASVALLTGRANWWNATKAFLKASVTTQVVTRDQGTDEERPIAVARVNLDLDVPLSAGIAPVQVQALLRDVVDNINAFVRQSAVETLTSQVLW